jgi:hypothetical protein
MSVCLCACPCQHSRRRQQAWYLTLVSLHLCACFGTAVLGAGVSYLSGDLWSLHPHWPMGDEVEHRFTTSRYSYSSRCVWAASCQVGSGRTTRSGLLCHRGRRRVYPYYMYFTWPGTLALRVVRSRRNNHASPRCDSGSGNGTVVRTIDGKFCSRLAYEIESYAG